MNDFDTSDNYYVNNLISVYSFSFLKEIINVPMKTNISGNVR